MADDTTESKNGYIRVEMIPALNTKLAQAHYSEAQSFAMCILNVLKGNRALSPKLGILSDKHLLYADHMSWLVSTIRSALITLVGPDITVSVTNTDEIRQGNQFARIRITVGSYEYIANMTRSEGNQLETELLVAETTTS